MSEPLFTFAVIADTHTRPEEGDESSPWEVNLLANGRARYVVEQVRRLGQIASERFHVLLEGGHDLGRDPLQGTVEGRLDLELHRPGQLRDLTLLDLDERGRVGIREGPEATAEPAPCINISSPIGRPTILEAPTMTQ